MIECPITGCSRTSDSFAAIERHLMEAHPHRCDLCWTDFPNDSERAAHVEMEESIDWPVDGLAGVPE